MEEGCESRVANTQPGKRLLKQSTDKGPKQGRHIGSTKKALNLKSVLVAEEKEISINVTV